MRPGALGGIVGIALLLAACGGSDAIVVGSKNFSEQVLLGELVAQRIERETGLTVDRRLNLGGTLICDQALRSGQLDVYVEYTGTALTAILGEEPVRDPDLALGRVRRGYRPLGIEWLDPLGFNNTFVILVRGETARSLGITTISEAKPYAKRWKPGFGYEFKERKDGFDGLVSTYGLEFAQTPRFMELGLLYPALAQGRIDLTAGNSTDGLIESLDLFVLRDDRNYFPPYDAAILLRDETIRRHPEVRRALSALSGAITDERMRHMNFAVDGKRRSVREVASEFLDSLKGSRGVDH